MAVVKRRIYTTEVSYTCDICGRTVGMGGCAISPTCIVCRRLVCWEHARQLSKHVDLVSRYTSQRMAVGWNLWSVCTECHPPPAWDELQVALGSVDTAFDAVYDTPRTAAPALSAWVEFCEEAVRKEGKKGRKAG